jgi:hypothetical protein
MRLLLSAGALVLATSANAALIDGTLSIYPNALIEGLGNSQTITFTPPIGSQEFPPYFGRGDLSAFNGASTFAVQNTGATTPWQQFGQGSDLSCGVTCAATGTNGTLTWALDISYLTFNINTEDTLSIGGVGTLSLTGFDDTLAHWWLYWSRPVMNYYAPPPTWAQFSIEAVRPLPIPSPIAGAGLPGLLLASLGWLGWRRRARRQ